MHDVFQRVGTLPSCRLRLKTRWSGSPSSAAQVLRSRGHTWSGPAAFRGRSFLSSPLTWSAVKQGGGWEEGRGGDGWCQREVGVGGQVGGWLWSQEGRRRGRFRCATWVGMCWEGEGSRLQWGPQWGWEVGGVAESIEEGDAFLRQIWWKIVAHLESITTQQQPCF